MKFLSFFIAEIYYSFFNNEFFTLAKFKMPISQQRNMVETSFKNWHVQENQLYKVGNMEMGAY